MFISEANNTYSELGIDIDAELVEFGDFSPIDPTAASIFDCIDPVIRNIISSKLAPLILGGDHSITYAILKSLRQYLSEPCVIVHFDAHPDIYENFMDNPDSHASPFARILEQKNLCRKLISIGIRTATSHQRSQIERYDVTTIEAKDFPSKGTSIPFDQVAMFIILQFGRFGHIKSLARVHSFSEYSCVHLLRHGCSGARKFVTFIDTFMNVVRIGNCARSIS